MRITNVAEVAATKPEALSGTQAQWAGKPPAPSQHSYAAPTPPSDPAARQSPQASAPVQPLIQRMSSERWRMASSLLLSLLIHGSLLSLTSLARDWGFRAWVSPGKHDASKCPSCASCSSRHPSKPAEPAVKSVAAPAQQASIEPPAAGARAPTPPASPAPTPGPRALELVPAAKPKADAKPHETPWPVLPLRKRLCAPVSRVTQCPRRSPGRPRST